MPPELPVAGRVLDLPQRLPPACVVAAVEQHRCPGPGELGRERTPEPVGRTRDQDHLVRKRSHHFATSRVSARRSISSAARSLPGLSCSRRAIVASRRRRAGSASRRAIPSLLCSGAEVLGGGGPPRAAPFLR